MLTALAPDGVISLKVAPPDLQSPINDAETDDLSPLLTITNAQPSYIESTDFMYLFEVYRVLGNGAMVRVRASSVAQTANTTSYRVKVELEQSTTHMWRARAKVGDEKGPWSEAATFRTPLLLGVPTPVSPIDGATTSDTRPFLVVQNGDVPANSVGVTYEFQLDDEGPSFPHPSTFSVPRSSGTQTMARFNDTLAPDTMFYWRVRATDGTNTSDWSAAQSFRTPDEARTPDPAPGQKLPLPNQAALIQQVAATNPGALANSCIEETGDWTFMDLSVAALRATDTRWAYNCKRGDCNATSIDVVTYFYGIGDGNGSTDVYLIDIISKACPGGSQEPSWVDQTNATADAGAIGRGIFPRP